MDAEEPGTRDASHACVGWASSFFFLLVGSSSLTAHGPPFLLPLMRFFSCPCAGVPAVRSHEHPNIAVEFLQEYLSQDMLKLLRES